MAASLTDWAASGRYDSYRMTLADPFTLQDVTDCPDADFAGSSITYGYYTDNIAQATLALADGSWVVDGRDMLVRVYHRVVCQGADIEECLGTFFVDDAPEVGRYGHTSTALSCYSTLWRFTQDVLVFDFYRDQGYNVIQAIRDIVEADGGLLRPMGGADESRTFGGWIIRELGMSRSEAITSIAGWIDHQIGVDDYGYITVAPYVRPAQRPVVYEFVNGENCVCLPGTTRTRDNSAPINRVVMYYSRESKDEGDTLPLTDRVMLALDPTERYSYERCGRRRSEVVRLDDAITHDQLEDKADTYLAENSGSSMVYEIEHVGIPGLRVGDVVRYSNDTDFGAPVDGCLCLVCDMDVAALAPGMRTRTKLKVVG